jgi:hypothetical protein
MRDFKLHDVTLRVEYEKNNTWKIFVLSGQAFLLDAIVEAPRYASNKKLYKEWEKSRFIKPQSNLETPYILG